MSNPTFRIIESSPFRFVREEDPNLLQTDHNRHYVDYDYFNRYFAKTYTLINQSDGAWWQFRTTYTDIVTELYNCDGLVSTLTNIPIRTEAAYTYYQVNLDTSSLDGYYYLKHSMETDAPQDGTDFPITHFSSDWFNVSEDHKYTSLIEYSGGNANEIPTQWALNGSKTQQLRLRSDVRTYAGGNMLTTMIGSDNNIVTLISDPVNGRMLNIDNINEYVSKAMNIAVSHDKFWINGEEFKTDEPIDFGEPAGDTITYTFKVKIQQQNYLNYASDPILTGTAPVIPVTTILAETGISIMAELGVGIKAS